MRKTLSCSFALLFSVFAIAQQGSSTPTQPEGSAPAAGQSGNEIVGYISDSKCGKTHTVQPGSGPAGCTRYCVANQGAHYILVVGDKIYALSGDPKELDNYAGETVKVRGAVGGGSIKVQSIEPY